MKLSRSKHNIDDGSIETLPPRRRQKSRNDGFRVGYTIAGESRQKRQAELERTKAHKKKRRKNKAVMLIVVLFLMASIAAVAIVWVRIVNQREAELMAEFEETTTPTVPIIDENESEAISGRVTEFVAHLEDDVREYGFEIERVVLPFQKAREVRIYLKEHSEYYKLTIDRGSAVQAEDMSRIVKYLIEKNIACEYVDLRVKGRAYFK